MLSERVPQHTLQGPRFQPSLSSRIGSEQMPKVIRNVSFCPHCSNTAPQRLVHTQRYKERVWNASLREESEPASWSIFVAACETCAHILLYENYGDQLDEREFHNGELEFPKYGLPISVPSPIRGIYDDARRIRSLNPDAFATQIRRALEALCNDRNAKGHTLASQLRDLAKRNEIPDVLVDLANTVRLVGNVGAHAGSRKVHQLQAYQIDEFFRVLVEFVYIAPRKLSDFKSLFED